MTKIDIVSGFLGAGKTTLIKKLIADGFNGERLVLIENEFGEIGIDGGFLKDAGIQITEMNSGCICCSLVGDFGKALKEVLEKYAPDRIIIEPSGVGKLSDVIKAVSQVVNDDVVINSLVAIVDAKKCKMYIKNFGEFFNNQVESAKTIILSRTQLLNEDKLEQAIAMLKELNDSATIITTPWDEISGTQIVKAMEQQQSFAQEVINEHKMHEEEHHHNHDHEHGEGCTCGCHDHDHEEHEHHHNHEEHHHDHDHEHGEDCTCGCHDHNHEHGHHHADDVFTSWGAQTPHKYDKEELEAVLEKLADTKELGIILRAKGMVAGKDGQWLYFDLTPGEYEIRNGEADVTGRLCVIGTQLDEDKINEAFHVA